MSSRIGARKYSHTRANSNRDDRKERLRATSEYFSSADEVPMVLGNCGNYSYHEVLATSKGTLELKNKPPYEAWILNSTIPVVSLDELCPERLIPIVGREGHLVSICRRQKHPWGYQIRGFTAESPKKPENELEAEANRILALAGFANQLSLRA